jgi:Concanavalin A-like lectin/glucanases superfamily
VSVKTAILATQPTSYWPLDDAAGTSCHDEMGLHDATVPTAGVNLAVIPFGEILAPYFDGELGSSLEIDSDSKYSQPNANALTVAAWICPLALDYAQTAGAEDQYVYLLEKAVAPSTDVEWAVRFYNKTNPTRHSRLSFYTFNLGSAPGEGNGSYMEYGVSANDETPIELGKWVFVVGEAESYISSTDLTTGCILWKQSVEAKRVPQDKYGHYRVEPQSGSGAITIGGTQETAFKGSIAHVVIWNRLLSATEIASIWSEGESELRSTPMYHSYV